jgi:SAM-dependent methyltransferase
MTEPRRTFNEDPELYDRRRPGYPDELFDDLAALAHLGPGSRVLEIGSGSGKATVPLARLGYRVTAVELGAELAMVARRNLAEFRDAEIIVSTFEDWLLPAVAFDLVLFATSFHWIDPQVRVVKSAAALRPGGSLAIVSTHHVAGGTERFFVDVQRCYERFEPDTPPGLRLPPASQLPPDVDELTGSGLFGSARIRRYEWDQTYTTDEYIDVLMTYSGHRAMHDGPREQLLACTRDLIDRDHGGQITKRYMTQLAVADREP